MKRTEKQKKSFDQYYKILGVKNNATMKEIKTAYKKCAFKVHPVRLTFYHQLSLIHIIVRIRIQIKRWQIKDGCKQQRPILFCRMWADAVFMIHLAIMDLTFRQCSTDLTTIQTGTTYLKPPFSKNQALARSKLSMNSNN